MAHDSDRPVCTRRNAIIAAAAIFFALVFSLLTAWLGTRERVKMTMRPHLILARNHMLKIRNSLVHGQSDIYLREKWEVGSDKDVMEKELNNFHGFYFIDRDGLNTLFGQITTFTQRHANIKNAKDFQELMTQQRRDNAIAQTHEMEGAIVALLGKFRAGGFLIQGLALFLALLSMAVSIFFARR